MKDQHVGKTAKAELRLRSGAPRPPAKPAKQIRKRDRKGEAARRAAKLAAPAPRLASGFLAGMTVTDCCDGCDVNGCTISEKPYCAHPRKGGLHAAQISDPAALKRLNQAKKLLGKQLLDARSPEE